MSITWSHTPNIGFLMTWLLYLTMSLGFYQFTLVKSFVSDAIYRCKIHIYRWAVYEWWMYCTFRVSDHEKCTISCFTFTVTKLLLKC